jgi:hypothetical protein
VWGRAGLSHAEQSQLDDESLLILRFLTIAGVALRMHKDFKVVMEHPRDPDRWIHVL